MQDAIVPSSNAGILVLGWHQRARRKVNLGSGSDSDFWHPAFGFASALTPTRPAQFVASWVILK